MHDATQKLSAIREKRKRWQTRLTRATNMLVRLHRQEARLMKPPKPAVETVLPIEVVLGDAIREANRAVADEAVAKVQAELESTSKTDDLEIPKWMKRDPNADALKAMNKRIEQRAASRSKKPAKPKAPSRLIAKAMAERDAINEAAKK